MWSSVTRILGRTALSKRFSPVEVGLGLRLEVLSERLRREVLLREGAFEGLGRPEPLAGAFQKGVGPRLDLVRLDDDPAPPRLLEEERVPRQDLEGFSHQFPAFVLRHRSERPAARGGDEPRALGDLGEGDGVPADDGDDPIEGPRRGRGTRGREERRRRERRPPHRPSRSARSRIRSTGRPRGRSPRMIRWISRSPSRSASGRGGHPPT